MFDENFVEEELEVLDAAINPSDNGPDLASYSKILCAVSGGWPSFFAVAA